MDKSNKISERCNGVVPFVDSDNEIVIPETWGDIKAGAFMGNSMSGHLKIPPTIKRLDDFTFCLCRNLDRVTISGEMSYIGFRCFSGCHSLKAIEIPDSVDMICEYAFEDCWSLKSIRLPKSLKIISLGLFNRCYSLEEIELPDMVELLKQEIIGYCRMRRGLKLPQFGSPEESIINVMPSLMDIFKAFVLRECKSLKRIVVPEDSIERYKAITPERHHHMFVAK